MRFARMPGLPAAAAGAAALLACSGPVASQNASEAAPPGNESGQTADRFTAGQSAEEIARALCLESVRQRFGISPDDVTGHTFGGGGDSPRTIEGQVTLNLFGPPARDYRCELAGGAVTSTIQLDAEGNPIGPGN